MTRSNIHASLFELEPDTPQLETRAVYAKPSLLRDIERIAKPLPGNLWIDTTFDKLLGCLLNPRQHLGLDDPLRPARAELVFHELMKLGQSHAPQPTRPALKPIS